ncbi:OmpH family outer membrane protein [Rariglobus hedericola]|uniref:OmpH family outer membrane protein n=1 Tax=Rariglobus hedericola TaxID=2597822 RepID=A0A556QLD2_9BACT|nr:OmpH family outer membrane protein [Rariglobus hedericola]TSJ77441.1 OmpH family outer membrane protein [Rariglobus hedericola]
MKTSLKSLIAVAFAGLFAVAAQAQPAPKVLIVDMAKLYDGHFKTEEQNGKLKADQAKAEEELQKLNAEGNSLVKQFNDLKEQVNNPALSSDAKAKSQADLEAKGQEIQRKQNDVNQFRANTQRSLQQRINNFKQFLLEEISKIAIDIAKKKGATLLLDKSGPTLIGVPSVLYFDAGYDITEDVAKEINKERPAGSVSASTSTSTSTSAPAAKPASSEAPSVSFPGAKK